MVGQWRLGIVGAVIAYFFFYSMAARHTLCIRNWSFSLEGLEGLNLESGEVRREPRTGG